MVNNINKTDYHLSPQLTVLKTDYHLSSQLTVLKKRHHEFGHPGPGLGVEMGTKMWYG